ncbi:MAG: UDP-N-acetylglucosamine--N-acetylmuramyl-(pentapeptide) pyrophosphoryl-undecaprenol N-acetylglucosamine transferase [Bacteriovoracia bacterium]
MKNHVFLVAGGTGGHINAAIALGERLEKKNFSVSYLTGQRPLDYKLFKGLNVDHLASWPLRTKNPIKLISALFRNSLVFLSIYKRFKVERPQFVVGAGGYVCGPTLLAAKIQKIPVFIIEQNAVLGLTNRMLARMSDLIFTHFKETKNLPPSLSSRVRIVGNPTRSSIAFQKARIPDDILRILVFGGSLGATQINELIQRLAKDDSPKRFEIIHQTGKDDNPTLVTGKNVSYQAFKYLDSIQDQYAWCDVVVARAGASTVAELRIVKKPCFLIPFPQATDNHQWWNATQYRDEVDYHVEVVDSRASQDELYKSLKGFLLSASNGTLRTSQSLSITVDSGDKALEEIFRYVGTIQEN